MTIREVESVREKVLVAREVFEDRHGVRRPLQKLCEGIDTEEAWREVLRSWTGCKKDCRWYWVGDGLDETMRILLVDARTELVFIQKGRYTSMTLKGGQSWKGRADVKAVALYALFNMSLCLELMRALRFRRGGRTPLQNYENCLDAWTFCLELLHLPR